MDGHASRPFPEVPEPAVPSRVELWDRYLRRRLGAMPRARPAPRPLGAPPVLVRYPIRIELLRTARD